MTLWGEFLGARERRAYKWAHYFPVYERHLAHLCNKPVRFLEVGVAEGGSLQMWKRWLGPLATVVGIDIDPACRRFEERQIHIRIGDQADPAFLAGVVREFGPFDAVLDDGSHKMEHVNATFDALYEHTAERGIYMVEDLHTAYWPEYGGGLGRDDTFMERAKGFVDKLNAHHTRGVIKPDAFTRSTWSMHFYDSIVAFERGRLPAPPYDLWSPG